LDRQLFDFSSLHLEKAQEGDEDAWLDQDGARV